MQGNQLRRDLNDVVGGNGNWNIPRFWPPLLRYASAPILAIVFSFAYPEFYTLRYDPMMIAGFILAHLCLLLILLGVILPRYYNIFVPRRRRSEGTEVTIPQQPKELGTPPGFETLGVDHTVAPSDIVNQSPDKAKS